MQFVSRNLLLTSQRLKSVTDDLNLISQSENETKCYINNDFVGNRWEMVRRHDYIVDSLDHIFDFQMNTDAVKNRDKTLSSITFNLEFCRYKYQSISARFIPISTGWCEEIIIEAMEEMNISYSQLRSAVHSRWNSYYEWSPYLTASHKNNLESLMGQTYDEEEVEKFNKITPYLISNFVSCYYKNEEKESGYVSCDSFIMGAKVFGLSYFHLKFAVQMAFPGLAWQRLHHHNSLPHRELRTH